MDERSAPPALIAFDADDTLWDNEIHFETAKDRFKHLLAAGRLFLRTQQLLKVMLNDE